MDVHDVVTRGLAGSPRVPLRFQLALRAPDGPVLGPDQAVLRRLTLGSRTVPTPFLQLKELRGIELTPGRFQATSQDDSLFPISQVSASSVWARHSETLLTTDCAAAARAEATYNHLKTTAMSRSCLLQQTTIYRTVRGDCPDAGFLSAVLQWFPFIIRHITHGKRMGIQRI